MALIVSIGILGIGLFTFFDEGTQLVPVPITLSPQPSPSLVDPLPETAKLPKGCRKQSEQSFVPTRVIVRGIVKTSVLALGVDENDAPAAPPLSQPDIFSWYKLGRAPGSQQGNVLLLAHTFSTRPVLGNVLLQKLHQGDLIILKGQTKQQRACYRVSVQPVPVEPADYGQLVYQWYTPAQLTITVCSDYDQVEREWRTRTVWFASPVK